MINNKTPSADTLLSLEYGQGWQKEDQGVPYQEIFYIDEGPGVGKTYACISLMEKHIKKDRTCVVVYAAPTIILLQQVMDDLLNRFPKQERENVIKNHMRMVVSNFSKEHEKHRETLSNSVLLGRIAHKVVKGPVDQQFHALLDGGKTLTTKTDPVKNGTVIFCTHDCIMNLPMNLFGKNRCSLIFDEARDCLELNSKINIPTHVVNHFLGGVTPIVEQSVRAGTGFNIWRWNREVSAKERTHERISEVWTSGKGRKPHPKTIIQVKKLLDATANYALDVWVAGKVKVNTLDITIDVLKNPAHMLSGWGKVLLLAANFKQSQMGRILLDKENSYKKTTHYAGRLRKEPVLFPILDSVVLTNVSDQLIDPKRRKLAQARMDKVKITYIFDDLSISRTTHLAQGMVVPKEFVTYGGYDQMVKKYQNKYLDLISEQKKKERIPSFVKALEGPNDFRRILKQFLDQKKYKDCYRFNTLQFMADRSVKLYEAWGKSKHRLLFTCNKSGLNIKDLYQEQLKSLIGNKVKKIAPMAQGLNGYTDYTAGTFLAVMKFSDQQKNLFQAVIPEYNAQVDRTAGNCLQFLMRTNARDVNSKKECLFIVTDLIMAKAVAKQLRISESNIIPPSKLLKPEIVDYTVKVMPQPYTEETKKAKVESKKRYDQSDKGKARNIRFAKSNKYNSLNVRISKCKKALANDPNNKELKVKLEHLIAERSKEKQIMQRRNKNV